MSHEATFDFRNKAKADRAQHSTASMAGHFCRRIGADWLFLTHFSSRYEGTVAATAANNKFSSGRTPYTQVKQLVLSGHCICTLLSVRADLKHAGSMWLPDSIC